MRRRVRPNPDPDDRPVPGYTSVVEELNHLPPRVPLATAARLLGISATTARKPRWKRRLRIERKPTSDIKKDPGDGRFVKGHKPAPGRLTVHRDVLARLLLDGRVA